MALVFLLLFAGLVQAQIYRVVTPDGSVTYTDTPPEYVEAEEVELPDIIIIQPATDVRGDAARQNADSPAAMPYSLHTPRIMQPAEQQVIPPGQRQVSIQARVDLGLPSGHAYLLLINGSPVGSPVNQPSWVLDNPNPGEQRAQVAIVDTQGRRLAVSAVRIFYVIR